MPRPQSSVVLLDPPRFAECLAAHRRVAGFRSTGFRGEPMGLRAFARALGLSAPALLMQMRGDRRHLRVPTLRGIWRLQERLLSWVQTDKRRLFVEALLRERRSFSDCCVALGGREAFHAGLQHACNFWSMEEDIVEAIERLETCAAESWVIPERTEWRSMWDERPRPPRPLSAKKLKEAQRFKDVDRIMREMVAQWLSRESHPKTSAA